MKFRVYTSSLGEGVSDFGFMAIRYAYKLDSVVVQETVACFSLQLFLYKWDVFEDVLA